MTIQSFSTLYSFDSKGKIRVWFMEVEDNKHRSISGLEDGKKVISTWNDCLPMNVGKANETASEQQAILEVEALYRKKTDRDWSKQKPTNVADKKFKPMLAEKYEDHKITFPVASQPKFDGFRCIANKDGLWTRNGKPYKSVPHIWKAIEHLFVADSYLILDGELYNHKLKEDFNKIASLVKQLKPTEKDLHDSEQLVQYHVYDYYSDKNENFDERYKNIFKLIDIRKECLCIAQTIIAFGQNELNLDYAHYLEQGYEGQMIRDLKSTYQQKRTKYLLKRKEFVDEEFRIVDVVEGVGNWSGMAKSIILVKKDSTQFSSGIRGNQDEMKQMLIDKHKYIAKLATVRYQNLTPDGIPRFPVITEIDVSDK